MDKEADIDIGKIIFSGLIISMFLIFGWGFVFADHVVFISTAATQFSFTEDTTNTYNVTVNSTDGIGVGNITQVNITFPSSFSFLGSSQGSNAAGATFSNTSTVLDWVNASILLLDTNKSFWFNLTCTTPGDYNINVTSLNGSGSYTTSLNVTINDTTAPASIDYGITTDANGSYLANYINYNITATDNGVIDTIIVRLYNSTRGLVNSSNSSTSPLLGAFSALAAGTYYINATINDTYNNANSTTFTRTFFVKTFFNFNGTVKDVNGVALNNTNVSIKLKDSNWADIWTHSAMSNASGWFNLNVSGNSSDQYNYQLFISYTNSSDNFVEYVGQSLPAFPYREFSTLSSPNFYLKEAGTINITAINSSHHYTTFAYSIKDQKLGYPVEGCVNPTNKMTTCYVPKNRNYSIMIYQNSGGETNFVPVSFNWNNFSSSNSYNITDGINYNHSKYLTLSSTLHKTFNISESFSMVSGYVKLSTINITTSWRNFTIVPFLTEPGNMIFMSAGTLPFNASSFNQKTDQYNATNGWYNITLPYAAAETVNYIIFAAGENATKMGGYRNLTVNAARFAGFNFTMYELMGGEGIINMSAVGAAAGARRIVYTKRQNFSLVNSSAFLSQLSAHIETTVDYSSYNCTEFTFMDDISQTGGASFTLPLLNVTGVKEMNVYSMNYAPKRVPKRTVAQIYNNSNITLATFNPQALDGTTGASISIDIYTSNSTCDVPAPAPGCALTSSSNMASFNPFSIVVGGGAISFRMGMSGVLVHYVNVDMLASGPPDALFEDNADITEGTSGGFSKAMRFGSGGPTIYDYVLVSMPYTEGTSSASGLNESNDVNISIPNLYDDDWNVIWNATTNGTNGSALAGNFSHYNSYQSDWENLLGQINCTTNVSVLNTTNPCFINKTSNRIWIRLPHFSGTGPDVAGDSVVASSSDSGSSGGTSTTSYWTMTYSPKSSELKEGYNKKVGVKKRVKVIVATSSGNETHHVGVVAVTSNSVTINVSSTIQQAVLIVGDTKKFDVTDDNYYDLSVTLNSVSGTNADLTIKSIKEEMPAQAVDDTTGSSNATSDDQKGGGEADEDEESPGWVLIIIIIIALMVGVIVYWVKNKYFF